MFNDKGLIQAGLLTWLLLPFVLSDTFETIASLDAYKSQRSCGQACFWSIGAGAEEFDLLGITLGCTRPVRDSCYCRTDVQVAAESYLSTCIISSCSGPGAVSNDISMATSIYDGYCLAKGYTADRNPATVAATTTAAVQTENPEVTKTVFTSSPTSNVGVSSVSSASNTLPGSSVKSVTLQTSQSTSHTSTPTSNSTTPTPTSSSKFGSSGGLGQNDIITIVFGILGAVIAIGIGIWQGRGNSALRRMISRWGHEGQRSESSSGN